MEAFNDQQWMDAVRNKLVMIYHGNEEDLVRVLHYLDEEDIEYLNSPRRHAPQWDSLKATINSGGAFRMYADRLASDAKKCENDERFRAQIRRVYEDLLLHCDAPEDIGNHQGLDVMRLQDQSLMISQLFRGLERCWDLLPCQNKKAIIETVLRIGRIGATSNVTTVALRSASTVAAVGLSAVHLTYKIYCHIKRWWNGEIDGKWCAKHIIDDIAAIGAGAAGAIGAGAACGSALGPIGAVTGAIIGGLFAGLATNFVIDRITQYIFGLPKSEALSNAYRYLGVSATASNSEVNTAYRKRCLQHHPDRGGDREEFFILQLHMSTIRQARGEF